MESTTIVEEPPTNGHKEVEVECPQPLCGPCSRGEHNGHSFRFIQFVGEATGRRYPLQEYGVCHCKTCVPKHMRQTSLDDGDVDVAP